MLSDPIDMCALYIFQCRFACVVSHRGGEYVCVFCVFERDRKKEICITMSALSPQKKEPLLKLG